MWMEPGRKRRNIADRQEEILRWFLHALATAAIAVAAIAHVAPAISALPSQQPQRWSQLSDTVFQHLNVENGLPHSQVMALAQDGDGYLWVGTQGGLARWDGYRFRVYQPNPQDAGSLPDNLIQTLHTDRRGRLWIGASGGGVARYDSKLDRFIRIPVGPGGISYGNVYSIADDDGEGLWIGTRDGLDHWIPNSGPTGGTVIHLRRDDKDAANAAGGLPSNIIRTLMRDRNGTLWVGTRKGLVHQDRKTGGFISVPLPAAGPTPHISSLGQSSDGRIWVGTEGRGAFVIDTATANPQPVRDGSVGGERLSSDIISSIEEVFPGQVWLGTVGQGIVVVDAATLQGRRLRQDPVLPTSLIDNSIMSLLRDRSGLVWAGSPRGLSRNDPSQNAIISLFGNVHRTDSIADADVSSVFPMTDGSIWLGLRNKGINIIDPAALAP